MFDATVCMCVQQKGVGGWGGGGAECFFFMHLEVDMLKLLAWKVRNVAFRSQAEKTVKKSVEQKEGKQRVQSHSQARSI